MFKWLKYVFELPLDQRLTAFWLAGFIKMGIAIALAFSWQKPIPSSYSHWVTVEGYVNSNPQLWSEDHSLVHFAVRYKVAEGMRDRAPAYAAKEKFFLAPLERGSAVLVDIESVAGDVVVQRVRSAQGAVLFNTELRERVRQRENRSVVFGGSLFGMFGLACLSSAVYLRFRKPRTRGG